VAFFLGITVLSGGAEPPPPVVTRFRT
jgi:hypothetical protein